MMIYHVILFSGFVILQIAGEKKDGEQKVAREKIYDITKVTKKALKTGWQRCTDFNFRNKEEFKSWKKATTCTFKERALKTTRLFCNKNGGKKLGLKATLVQFTASYYEINIYGDDVAEGAKSVCGSIKDKFEHNPEIYTVRYYHDNIEWCDVYRENANHLKLDKCENTDEELKWLRAKKYAGASLFKTHSYADNIDYKDCLVAQYKPHVLCTKDGVVFTAHYVCVQKTDALAFKVVASYEGVALQDFQITRGTVQYNEGGMETSCRLFDAKVESNGNKILVQYYFWQGFWKCMEFNRMDEHNFESVIYSVTKRGPNRAKMCPRFGGYNLPERK